MPTYVYDSCRCDNPGDEVEINVPIDERDNQFCPQCKDKFERKIVFTGLTWAPTAGGMR